MSSPNKFTAYLCGHTTGADCGSGQIEHNDFVTFDRLTAETHAAKHPNSWTTLYWKREIPFVMPVPTCPKCGNNRQVWQNQISGKWRCHRVSCEQDLE